MQTIVELFDSLCHDLSISVDDSEFVYFIDFQHIMDAARGHTFSNLTPNYRILLENGLISLKYREEDCTNKFCHDYNSVIDSLCILISRICLELDRKKPCNYETKLEWFRNMIDKPAAGFFEAIQRILFLNQIMWQTNHRLLGLGTLDTLLDPFYRSDTAQGKLSKEDVAGALQSFCRILHQDFKYKSNMLLGDTGQIIVLGKSDEKGNYLYNDLTILFIEAIEKLNLPDPKILLRVNKNTPREVLRSAVRCISTGVGAPLLANDDVIVPQLVKYGVPMQDALDYTVSACWEPLICGKDASHNNLTTLNFMRSLDNLIMRDQLSRITSFEDFKKRYLKYLSWNLNAVKRVVGRHRFQYDPVLSVFMEGCFEKRKDVSHGGAVYNDVGITTVALSNTVNALLNIKEYVFERKLLSLVDVKTMLVTNFKGKEDWIPQLKAGDIRYGHDEDEVISLTNEIIRFVTEETKDFATYLGGRMKFGLSAPSYIDAAKVFPASFDGRKRGEPFHVHISNDKAAYTEVVNFAAALDYGDNRFNGNVVDLMVTPVFIENNFDKFIDFVLLSIKVGFFQMQMNVISSDRLIAAKENPEAYPNLIVRVWGFSAYFRDLPVEYKDVLIERALRNEQKVS
jgi:formate C-acetyltransferase